MFEVIFQKTPNSNNFDTILSWIFVIFITRFKVTAMRRERAIQTINELPNEFSLEALIERLIFIEKVEKGLKQAEEGKTVSHEEALKRLRKW